MSCHDRRRVRPRPLATVAKGIWEAPAAPSSSSSWSLELELEAWQPAARRGGLPASRLRRLAWSLKVKSAEASSGVGMGRWGTAVPCCGAGCGLPVTCHAARAWAGISVVSCACMRRGWSLPQPYAYARQSVVPCLMPMCLHLCGLWAALLMALRGAPVCAQPIPRSRRRAATGKHSVWVTAVSCSCDSLVRCVCVACVVSDL